MKRPLEPRRFADAHGPEAAYLAAAKAAHEGEPAFEDDEEAYAWRRLRQRQVRRRRRPWLLAGAVGVAALGLWTVVAWREPPRPAAEPVVVAVPVPPPPPAPVRGAPVLPALIAGQEVGADGVSARLSRSGRGTVLPAGEHPPGFLLEDGTLEVDAAPSVVGPVQVRVAALRLQGHAARFRVGVAHRRTRLDVTRGEVSVWIETRLIARVQAGDHWVDPGFAGERPEAPAPSRALAAPPAVPEKDCLALAGRGETSAAIACLETQATSAGLSGELAFLELARIRRDVQGDLAGAERTLAAYRDRFPQGTLRDEAAHARRELQQALGRKDDPAP